MKSEQWRPLVAFAFVSVLCAVLMTVSATGGFGADLFRPGRPIAAPRVAEPPAARATPATRAPIMVPAELSAVAPSVGASTREAPQQPSSGASWTTAGAVDTPEAGGRGSAAQPTSPTPTAEPTTEPTAVPTVEPTTEPTAVPTAEPGRDAEKAQREAEREAAKAAREAEREAAKAARDAEREAEKAQREAEREAAKAAREAEKAQREAERDAAKAAREAEKAQREAERDAAKGGSGGDRG